MTAPQSSRLPHHHLLIWGRWAMVLSLVVVLAACGDNDPQIDPQSDTQSETVGAAIDYENKNQAATFLATIPGQINNPESPFPRIYQFSTYQEANNFAEEFGIGPVDLNMIGLTSFDSMDYFAVVEIVPCAHLTSRNAFVQSNRFIFEATYRSDNDLSCPAVLMFQATLFGVVKNDKTVRAEVDYQNSDQAAVFLATIGSLGHYVTPLPRIIKVGGDQDLALFEEEYGSNLTLRADFDFGSKDYFVAVEYPPCAHLVRREAYVQSNRFIFEASYRYDSDLACPADMRFTGTLFAVPKAL